MRTLALIDTRMSYSSPMARVAAGRPESQHARFLDFYAYWGGGAAVATILLLVGLHVLSPEFDPSWRMVSE